MPGSRKRWSMKIVARSRVTRVQLRLTGSQLSARKASRFNTLGSLSWAVVDAHSLAERPALPGPADPARDKRSLQSRTSRLGQVQEWRHEEGRDGGWIRCGVDAIRSGG